MARPWLVAALLVLAAACKHPAHDDALDRAPPSSRPPSSSSASPSSPSSSPSAAPLSCRALQSCTDSCADPACAETCVRRLTAAARPSYDALQACVVPACAAADGGAAPCRAPGSFACKMCVLARCASQAAACMSH
jgi:hypothetical protein